MDRQTRMDAVYHAEDLVQEWVGDYGQGHPDYLLPDQVEGFLSRALQRAGWAGGASPTVVMDIPDDSELAGQLDARDGRSIHLHPRLLSPWTVLHELAHWLRPLDGHGAEFRGVMVGLIRGMFGNETADELAATYKGQGVPADLVWDDGAGL